MTAHPGHRPFLSAILGALLLACPMLAQQTAATPTPQQLQKQLEDLMRQAAQIQQQLDQLKQAGPAPPSAPAPPPTSSDDLTRVDVIGAPSTTSPPAATQPPAAQPSAAMTDVETITNVSNPGASKALNPDISAIGNFLGKVGPANPYEFGPGDAMRSPLQLDEAEVAFQAYVDPYAKANFFLSATPEGMSIEEAYVQFVTLPYDLTARVGLFKAMFGKANTWHSHVRPWADQPLVIHNFFTDEQLADSGIEVSKVFPNSFAFIEGTAAVASGNNTVFHRQKQSDLFYNAHLKIFRDLTENNNIEVGTSYARGTLGESSARPGAASQIAGIDVTYRWKPLIRSTYNSMIARFEGMVDDRPDIDRRLKGFYASLDYQLAQRWFTGVRLDDSDRGTDVKDATVFGKFNDRGASATLTFWPSEFSQLRGQLRHTSYGGARAVNELLFQLQFSIGAHGAHTF